jgi:hypothetical protein
MLETTNNHDPYIIKPEIPDRFLPFGLHQRCPDYIFWQTREQILLLEERKCGKAGSRSKESWAGRGACATVPRRACTRRDSEGAAGR